MSAYLPLVMQQMFNVPLMMHESMSANIVAALHGRLNISELITSSALMDKNALDMRAGDSRSKPAKKLSPQYGKIPSAHAVDVGEKFLMLDNVAVIPVYGTLSKSGGLCTQGYNDFYGAHLDAMNSPGVKAIWYDVNSGGGGVAGCFGLTDLIHATNEKAGGKPVYAMAADNAYSAAYAIFAAADKGFVPDTGGVGSVGCITMVADASKAMDDEGIKVHVLRSAPKKALLSGVETITGDPKMEEALGAFADQVKAAGDIFTDRVAAYTGMSRKAVADTQGSDYMGADAKVIGFVSDVLSEAQAFAKLQRKIA